MKTNEQLRNACKALGMKPDKKATAAELQEEIDRALGTPNILVGSKKQQSEANANQQRSTTALLAKHGEEAVAKSGGPDIAAPDNIPNLSPTGLWQGKKARLKRSPTGHNDMGGAIFGWNGYPCIIPLNREVDIAWPIYEIIQNCVGMDMEITQEDDPKNKARVINKKNVTYYEKYPYQFLGITPGTEHLPESPWEYTLDQYVTDFEGYSVRMWRQLCILWDISNDQANIKPGISPEDEITRRRNSIHFECNLPMNADREVRLRVREQKRSDIGMEAKAA